MKKKRKNAGSTAHLAMWREHEQLLPPREKLADGCSRTLPTTVDGVDFRPSLYEGSDDK